MISVSRYNASYDVSNDNYQELLKKRLETIKKNAAAIEQLSAQSTLGQKSVARQRVEEIKKEIEALRRMLSLFGVGKDAKAILQQLKQLANQLKQAANVLRTPDEASVPEAPAQGAPAADAAASGSQDEGRSSYDEGLSSYDEGRSAYAEQQASADAEKVTAQIAPFDGQRGEDEKSLHAAEQALRGLRTWLERKVKQQDAQRALT